MGFKQALSVALFFSCLLNTSSAVPLLEARDVCSRGIYGELSPILEQYPVAQAFCSAVHPVSCTTAIKKRSVCALRVAATTTTTSGTVVKNIPITTSSTTKRTTTTTSKIASPTDTKASAWSRCQGLAANVVKTLCSCIETPKACTTKATTTSKTTTTITTKTTTSSSTTAPTTSTTSKTTTTKSTSTSSSSSSSATSTTTTSSSSTTAATTTTSSSSSTTATTTTSSSSSTTAATTTTSSSSSTTAATTTTSSSSSTTAATTTTSSSSSTTAATTTTSSSSTTTSSTTTSSSAPAPTATCNPANLCFTAAYSDYTIQDRTCNQFDASYVFDSTQADSVSTSDCAANTACANIATNKGAVSFRVYYRADLAEYVCDTSTLPYNSNDAEVTNNNIGYQYIYSSSQ